MADRVLKSWVLVNNARRPFFLFILLSLTLGCVRRDYNYSSQQNIKLHPLEKLLPDEAQLTKDAVDQALQIIEKNGRPNGKSFRDPHSKGFGCLKGIFKVAPVPVREFDTRADMRVGIFKKERSYHAWIRFSSSNPGNPQADTRPTGLGMAIKLLEVPGEKVLSEEKDSETLDFVMVNNPVFPVRNISEYLVAQRDPLKYGIRHPRTGKILFDILSKKNIDPSMMQYWSMSAYALGEKAIKFTVKPKACDERGRQLDAAVLQESGYFKKQGDDFLTENLVSHFRDSAQCYQFMIQQYVNDELTPVEDPSVLWSENNSPIVLAPASLYIPRQEFNTPKQQEFCENLSFSPWRTLPEHRPLGNLNRVRLETYAAVSKIRHQNNNTPRQEPNGFSVVDRPDKVPQRAYNAFFLWRDGKDSPIFDAPPDYVANVKGEREPDGLFYESDRVASGPIGQGKLFAGIPTEGVQADKNLLTYPERGGRKWIFFLNDSNRFMRQYDAFTYCNAKGMRLPTIREIFDFCNSGPKDREGFTGNPICQQSDYKVWSLSVHSKFSDQAWFVSGGQRQLGYTHRSEQLRVHCVDYTDVAPLR